METITPPITSLYIGPSTLHAPAPSETIAQQNPPLAEKAPHPTHKQVAELGHTATFTSWFSSPTSEVPVVRPIDTTNLDLIHFNIPSAGDIAKQQGRPQNLEDILNKEASSAMDALDIKPIELKPPDKPENPLDKSEPKPKSSGKLKDTTGYLKRYTYAGTHTGATPELNDNKTRLKRRIAKGIASIALVGALAGSTPLETAIHKADKPATAQETPHKKTQALPDVKKPVAKVIRSGEKIMGVSGRQQKIINNVSGLSGDQRKLLATYTTAMHKISNKLEGVNPDVMMAQGIWEGGWGKTKLAEKGHNLFGMKAGKNWKGDTGWYNTWEEENGRKVPQPALFREYPNDAASFEDHAKQMRTLGIYKDALGKGDSGYLDGILNTDHGDMAYATDSKYKSHIMGLIKKLRLPELTKIDRKPPRVVEVANATKAERIKMKIAEYSWPNYRHVDGHPGDGKGTDKMRPAYIRAVDAVKGNKDYDYIGSCDGEDCGGFVSLVMRNSGADPEYNKYEGNTKWQKKYLEDYSDDEHLKGKPVRYHHVKPGEALQPGDIAIQSKGRLHHTFFYVGGDMMGLDNNGKVTDFNGVLASASQCGRAPMASNDYRRGAFEWYRVLEDPKATKAKPTAPTPAAKP